MVDDMLGEYATAQIVVAKEIVVLGTMMQVGIEGLDSRRDLQLLKLENGYKRGLLAILSSMIMQYGWPDNRPPGLD